MYTIDFQDSKESVVYIFLYFLLFLVCVRGLYRMILFKFKRLRQF